MQNISHELLEETYIVLYISNSVFAPSVLELCC